MLKILYLLGAYGGIINGNQQPGKWNDVAYEKRIKVEKSYKRPYPYDRRQIKMKCIPLLSILKALGVTTVDYFSLDIEGAELQLLQALDFDQVDIKVISIEIIRIGHIFDGSYTKLDYMLRNRGYIKYAEMKHDVLFMKKDFLENTKDEL